MGNSTASFVKGRCQNTGALRIWHKVTFGLCVRCIWDISDILCLNLGLIPEISHHIYADIIQNLKSVWPPAFHLNDADPCNRHRHTNTHTDMCAHTHSHMHVYKVLLHILLTFAGVCSISTQETKAGGLLAGTQPGLCMKTPCQK